MRLAIKPNGDEFQWCSVLKKFTESDRLVVLTQSFLRRVTLTLSVLSVSGFTNTFPLGSGTIASAQAAGQQPLRVVVMPFKNMTQQPQDAWLSDSFAECLTMGLVKVEQLDLIERSQVEYLIKEQHFSQSLYVDQDTAPELGKMLGANVVVLGSFQKIGEQIQANVRFVNVATGKINPQQTGQVTGLFANVLNLQKDLVHILIEQLNVKVSSKEIRAVTEAVSNTNSPDAQHLYIEGLKYLRYEGLPNLDQANHFFMQALAFDPNYALAYAGLAETQAKLAYLEKLYHFDHSLVQEGHTDHNHAALLQKYALKGLELNPNLPEIDRALASFKRSEGDFESALERAKSALKLDLKDDQSIDLYLQIREEQSQYSVSSNDLLQELQALGVNIDDPWLKYNLANLALRENTDPRAVAQRVRIKGLLIEAQIELPDFPGVPLSLAALEIASGHREAARPHLEQAIKLSDNHYPYFQATAAQLLSSIGQKQRALELIETSQVSFPNNRQIATTHAMILYQNKRQTEAETIFLQLAQTAPGDANIPFNQGLAAFAYAHDYAQAAQYFEQANLLYDAQTGFSQATINHWLATSYLNLKQFSKAIPILNTLTQDLTFRRQAYSMLSTAYAQNQQPAQALTTFTLYLQLYPDLSKDNYHQNKYREYFLQDALIKQPQNPLLLNDLGQIMQLQHRDIEAETYYLKAVQLSPQHEVPHFNLGLLYFHEENYLEAQRNLSKAVKIKSDYAKAWYYLAQTELKLSHLAKAQAALEKVLAIDPNYPGAKTDLERLSSN